MTRILCLLIATATTAFVSSTARAADLSVPRHAPSPPAPAPVANWTGFYIDLNGGFGSRPATAAMPKAPTTISAASPPVKTQSVSVTRRCA
jgi:hypothetical protein